jgi:hypothetical protein
MIILDSIYENKMYEGKYNPDVPSGPVCYAFAHTEEELKPHEKSPSPKCEQCKGCQYNEWGTADQGKGKACKNIRRLAVISADGVTTPDGVKDSAVFHAEIPVTSVKGWCSYVKALAATLKRPPFGVITHVAVVPDAKSQFKVTFSNPRPIEGDLGGAIMQKVEEAKANIVFPYPEAREAVEEVKPKAKRKF